MTSAAQHPGHRPAHAALVEDLRTWCGSVTALSAIREAGPFENGKEAKQKIVAVLDKVAKQLGNTRTVCRKYYVHPVLLEIYEDGSLEKWLNKSAAEKNGSTNELEAEELLLLNILGNK